MNASTPKNRETTWLWLLKIVTGGLVIFVLGLHFVVNHLVAPGGLLSHAEVVTYYQSPWIVGTEIFFLITVVTHALLGLRSILLDLNPSDAVLRVINVLFVLIGVGVIIYGTWLALTVASR